MRAAFFTAALVATAFLSSPVAAADDYVKTVEEARAIAIDAKTVRVQLGSADVLAAVIERAPGIETLVIQNPGNAIDKAALPLLIKLPALTALTIGGDAFLYEDEFAALGRLSQLKELNLHLI